MKLFKKLLTIVAATAITVTSVLGLTACGNNTPSQKVIKVGYTENPPINYTNEKGELVGFDTEMAEKTFGALGYKVQFKLIEWENKYVELNSDNIDVIWNGFTANCEEDGQKRTDKVDISSYYMINKQAIVVNTAKQPGLVDATTLEAFDGKKPCFENGSAADDIVKTVLNNQTPGAKSQMDALVEVKSGAVDYAIVDVITAKNVCGKGDFSDLKVVEAASNLLPNEKYAVGFKKGNTDLQTKVNAELEKLYNDGTMAQLAEKYGIDADKIILEKYAA